MNRPTALVAALAGRALAGVGMSFGQTVAPDARAPFFNSAAPVAAWPGIAVGEAVHGIVRIGDSTPVGYWWTQCAVGVAVLVATCLWRARQRLSVTVAVLGTVMVASGLFLTYGAL